MIFTYNGKEFKIKSSSEQDHIYKTIKTSGTFYEEDLLRYIRFITKGRKINQRSFCIDVGANIGNHSIYFGAFLRDHVISIEPNRDITPVLHENLKINIKNYTIYEVGAGEKKGAAKIIVPQNNKYNTGMAKLSFQSAEGKDSVEVSTIDAIISNWRTKKHENYQLTFIKIDVEGMELSVLKGAEKTIQEYKPDIFAEAATLKNFQSINDYLRRFGYKKICAHASTPVYHFSHRPSIFKIIKARLHIRMRKYFS